MLNNLNKYIMVYFLKNQIRIISDLHLFGHKCHIIHLFVYLNLMVILIVFNYLLIIIKLNVYKHRRILILIICNYKRFYSNL